MNLSTEEILLFYDLTAGLYGFVNRQRGFFKGISSIQDLVTLPMEKKLKIRNALWKSPQLIDAYLSENPDSLTPEEMEIVRQWKKFIKDEFFIFRHFKKYSIFIKENNVYGVVGISQGLETLFPDEVLPVLAKAVLLPFKGRIIYDGLIESYPISFGGGIGASISREYLKAKEKGRIIVSLESVSIPLKKPAHNWMPQLEELSNSAGNLKGDSSLQKAAFTLVRESISLAKHTADDSTDITEINEQVRKTNKALQRLEKVLEIIDES